MVSWICAIFVVAAFVFLVKKVKLVEFSKEAISTALGSLKVLGNPDLNDDQKEVAMQQHSLRLFKLFFFLVAGGAAALFIPVGIVWVISHTGLISYDQVLAVLLSWEFILATTVVGLVVFAVLSRKKDQTRKYSSVDQMLHRLAFDTYSLQVPVARLESRLNRRKLDSIPTDRPVFITSLPRAGTTLLLECCAGLKDFATHCYRDMPFVLTPKIWATYSKIFKQSLELRERAHGDGMLINLDSPEAFEEIIWKTFWNDHYHNAYITPWETEQHPEFLKFFKDHMAKIILLRNPLNGSRYISKNNLNISRIPWLAHYFPQSTILVPIRDPVQHTTSLMKQHLNFLKVHQGDNFASEYMRSIGHFDFGKNLRPINFNHWMSDHDLEEAQNLNFWFEYWINSYRYLLDENTGEFQIFDYQKLCESPESGLEALAQVLQVSDVEGLMSFASKIHPGHQRKISPDAVDSRLLKDATAIFEELQNRAINK